MKRFIAVALGVVASLLLACPSPPKPACATLGTFDLSACEHNALSALPHEGIWNANVLLQNQQPSLMAITFVDGGVFMNGSPTVKTDFDGGFFVSTEYADSSGEPHRLSLAGCHVTGAESMSGLVKTCGAGTAADGTFDAIRLHRAAGEADSSGLTLVSETSMSQGNATDVFVDGGWAFVTTGTGGMSVVDVTDPAHPVVRGQPNGPGDFWNAATMNGNALYVASFNLGLEVFNAATPYVPLKIGSVPGGDYPPPFREVRLDPASSRLVASSLDGSLYLFRVDSPLSPVFLYKVTASGADGTGGKSPHDAMLVGDHLYASYGSLGFLAFDISASPAVQLGAGLASEGPQSHSLEIGTVGATPYAFDATLGWNGKVRIIDLTNPAAPAAVGSFATRAHVAPSHVDLVGKTLYVANLQDGVRVLDVSNPAAPVQTRYFNTWSDTDPTRGSSFFDGVVAVRAARDASGLVYVVDNSRGLLILRETP
jgi:hypothetical protein